MGGRALVRKLYRREGHTWATRVGDPSADSRAVSGPARGARHWRRVERSVIRRRRWSLSAGALAVPAPWPAARPTLAFLQLLPGPANAAFSGHLLLGVLDPADELVSGQRRDVLPSIECRRVGDQRLAQVCRKLVHHPTGHSRAAHRATVAVQGPASFTNSPAPVKPHRLQTDARPDPLSPRCGCLQPLVIVGSRSSAVAP
jgi:hypothetical protein